MIKAKDIMTDKPVYVKKDVSIFEAMELLLEHDIIDIPVVEDDMTLVGALSEKDVLQLLYAGPEEEEKTVRDLMTYPAVNFGESESFVEICQCLENNTFRRIPVTSEGKLVGAVSRKDIINFILEKRNEKIALGI